MTTHETDFYCNPLRSENLPDPFVLKVRGRYYLYSTEAELCPEAGAMTFPILTSENLIQWRVVGKAMPALGWPYCRYWAPEVTYHNGQFLLYYAVHTEEFKGSIRVAIADRPEGPFHDSGHDLTGHLTPWAIDPHVFRDYDGQWYLYMTIEYWNNANGLIGSGNAVDRLVTPFQLEGKLTRVTPPSQAWQLFQAQRPERGNVDWYTVEGPAVLRHRNRYYEMFSGGCYYRENYAMSYATSLVPMGTQELADISWQDWQGSNGNRMLVRGNRDYALSPGHNSIVLGPNNVDRYIAYHVLQPDMAKRYACLDRLFLHGDELWTNAPTHTNQPAPALPHLQETWDTSTPASSWQVDGGQWQSGDEAVNQEDSTATRARLRHAEVLSNAWLLEIHMRALEGKGYYGIFLESETDEVARITLTPSSHELHIQTTRDISIIPLPEYFVAEAWHQELITCSGRLLTVQLDYLQLRTLELAAQPTHFSLYTSECATSFGYVALTASFTDEFLDEQYTLDVLGWREVPAPQTTPQPARWQLQTGLLAQLEQRGEHLLMKGAACLIYECGTTLRLNRNDGYQQRAGLLARYSKAEQLFVWLASEELAASIVIEQRRPSASNSQVYELDARFKPQVWHTLRVQQQRDAMLVWLDGTQICTLAIQAQRGVCGIATQACSATFMRVWQTGHNE